MPCFSRKKAEKAAFFFVFSRLAIVKVNATVKRGHVAFSLTKRGVAFSLTNGKHELFVGVEGIFKANWATPSSWRGVAFSLTNIYFQGSRRCHI